jgi:type IX secretion system PorP/SprF family membrane protein
MKGGLIIILLIFINYTGHSQSNIRLNNYWENTYYINPASISSEYQFVASGAGRKQWLGFPGAPDTEFITFAARLFTNKLQQNQVGQIGIKIYRDNIGFTSLLNVSPSFSYSVPLYNESRLNFGFAYKIQSLYYDMTKSNPEIINDPVTNAIEASWSGHNIDAGIEYVGYSVLIGLASQNMISIINSDEYIQTNTNFLYGMYRQKIDHLFGFLLGASLINNKNLYQAELNASGMLSSRDLPDIQLGFLYRTRKEIGALFGINLSNTVRLAFSYDYHVGDISRSSFGTPEILLIWKFGILKNCECQDLFK